MGRYNILIVFVIVLLAGCIAPEPVEKPEQPYYSTPAPTVPVTPEITAIQVIQPTPALEEQYEEPPQKEENHSIAIEVNYREYVDWFLLNLTSPVSL